MRKKHWMLLITGPNVYIVQEKAKFADPKLNTNVDAFNPMRSKPFNLKMTILAYHAHLVGRSKCSIECCNRVNVEQNQLLQLQWKILPRFKKSWPSSTHFF